MKAVHLKNVPAAAKIYVPTDDSRVQSAVFPADRVDMAQTPAVWQRHGQGYIAYIGDVNNESGSQVLIMAMLSKLLVSLIKTVRALICVRYRRQRGPAPTCHS